MFIPVKDDNPTRHFPFVTILIIIANIAVFIYQLSLGGKIGQFIISSALIPKNFFVSINSDYLSGIPSLGKFVTSMFMHGGFLHIGGNMLYLWIFGNNVEDVLGHTRFVFFYLLCGIAASAVHISVFPDSAIPIIGASGAISGILGAYLFLFPKARVWVLIFLFIFIRLIPVPAALILGLWFFMQVALADSGGGIAWYAHIGGFVSGVLLLLIFLPGRKKTRRTYRQ